MAEHDGKVTFDLEIDDSRLRGDLARALNQVKAQANAASTKIKVDADTSAAVTNISKVKAAENGLAGKSIEIDATTPAIDAINDVNTEKDKLTGKTINISGTNDAAIDAINNVNTEEDKLTGKDIEITATDSATEQLENVRALADELNGKEVNVNVGGNIKNGILQGVGQKVGSGIIGAGGNVLSSVFSGGMGYESGLAKASTLMPEGADKEAFGAGLLALSSELGMDIGTMTEAAYNSLSASQSFGDASGDQMIDFLRTASKTAIGGFSDTNSVASALAKSINAYGGETSDAERYANVMLKTQNRGITDVDKLSSSLSHITSVAANSGVDFEQVGAMIATLTAQGVETAEATTQGRSLINELQKSGTTASKAMTAALQGTEFEGKSFSQIMEAGGNIVDIISQVDAYAKREGLTMTDMFSSVEASQAAQMLLVNGGETFADNLEYMRDEASVVDDAYSTMAETTEQSLARIKAQFQGYAIKLFDALSPAINKLLDVMQGEKFQKAFGKFVDKLTELLEGDAIDSLLDGLLNVLNWLLDFFADPWGTISSGITGLFEAAWGWLQGKAAEFGEWIRSSIATALEGLDLPDWVMRLLGINKGGETNEEGTPQVNPQYRGTYAETGLTGGKADTKGSLFGGGVPSGAITQEESFMQFPKAADTAQSAASLTTAMEDLSTDTAASAESAQAAAESQAQITEAQAAQAESQSAASESASLFASMWDASARQAQDMKGKVSKLKSALSSGAIAAGGLAGAVTNLVSSVNSAASRVAGATVTPPTATKYAVGLDYVPYDNYPALLHKGEMILTAAQASAFRVNSAGMDGGAMNAAALKAALNGMAFEIDGRRAGALVERGVSARQGVVLNRMNSRG